MIYIGYDPREKEAYNVCKHSIESRTDEVKITPLMLDAIRHFFTRPIEQKDGKLWCPISEAPMSTEFAISRFAIPFLEPTGWHLFMDCDMLVDANINELFALADPKYAVMVVKHKQESGSDTKMDGQAQTYYSRKNWSSVVLWNCDHPENRKLTLQALNEWPGRDLHAFNWLSDNCIGELPYEWNHLVGVNPPIDAKIYHYTLGGPWFDGWGIKNPEDNIWLKERENYLVF